ncbi:MAG: PqqD family protein [Acidobacteria bacterium]|nr:PqqD family protein [Acidobacteriota bacterium]
MTDATVRGDRVPERSQSMAWQTLHGETVLLHIDGKELMGLNDVGACIWHLADGTRSVEEITRTVVARFQAPAGSVATDVQAFVGELITLGALVWREG